MSKNRLTILDSGDFLRQVSEEVDFNDKSYLKDIKDLEDYCRNNIVFAMASIQIGIPKRIIYLKNTTSDMNKNYDSNYDEAKILINPIILKSKGHTRFLERCASCLDYVGIIDRPYSIIIEYYDIYEKKHIEEIKGFETTVLTHEYDHLNGILHMDLADVFKQTLEETKEYRKIHPYEVISENCDYDKIRSKKLKRGV